MFELESEVRNWRTRVERRSSLAPRELDELEDHLRALVDLELELDTSLGPRRAFAIARHALGEPKALSREFARAGRPRWKPLLAVASALYAASFLLPVLHFSAILPLNLDSAYTLRGWELLVDDELVPILLNLPMLLVLPLIWRKRRLKGTWLAVVLGAIGVSSFSIGVVAAGSEGWVTPRIGLFAWSASLVLASVALWVRRRNWASARSRKTALPV